MKDLSIPVLAELRPCVGLETALGDGRGVRVPSSCNGLAVSWRGGSSKCSGSLGPESEAVEQNLPGVLNCWPVS